MKSTATERKNEPLTSTEWRLVLLLTLINFTHLLDFVIVMPLGDRLRDELAITPSQYGNIVSIYGITATIAGIGASMVTDRFDRRFTMLLSFAGFFAATIYCALSPNYVHLLIARGLAGGFGGVVASTVMAFVMDLIPEQRRGKALGVITSSFAIASTIGLPIGLYIANWAGHFGAPFQAIAAVAFFVWLFAAFQLPSLPGQALDQRVKPLVMFASVIRQANHLWSFGFMLAMVFGTFMIVPFIAPYLEANCGLPREHLPKIYLIAGLLSLLVMNIVGWLSDRFGPRPVFTCAAGGAVLMTLVITNLPPVSLVLAIVVTSLFMSVASSRMVPAQAMMMQTADPKARGAFSSLNTAMSHFAIGVAPLIAGTIIGEKSPGGPLTNYWIVGLLAAFFSVLAIVLSYFLKAHASIPKLQSQPA